MPSGIDVESGMKESRNPMNFAGTHSLAPSRHIVQGSDSGIRI